MKISKIKKKEIEKEVNKYVKSLDVKNDEGNVTGTELANAPQTLLNFYVQPFFLRLATDNERFYAKTVFKDLLPYKEWADYVSKNPGTLRAFVEDFQEMVDPRYQRKTPRGGSVP